MVKRCCVKECKSSQKDDVQVSLFRLPSADKEPQERNKWIDVLCEVNEYLIVSTETVVCSKHWPQGYPVGKYNRPLNPPSVFVSDSITSVQEVENYFVDHSYVIDSNNNENLQVSSLTNL